METMLSFEILAKGQEAPAPALAERLSHLQFVFDREDFEGHHDAYGVLYPGCIYYVCMLSSDHLLNEVSLFWYCNHDDRGLPRPEVAPAGVVHHPLGFISLLASVPEPTKSALRGLVEHNLKKEFIEWIRRHEQGGGDPCDVKITLTPREDPNGS